MYPVLVGHFSQEKGGQIVTLYSSDHHGAWIAKTGRPSRRTFFRTGRISASTPRGGAGCRPSPPVVLLNSLALQELVVLWLLEMTEARWRISASVNKDSDLRYVTTAATAYHAMPR